MHPPYATLIALLDRLFYSTRFDKTMKVGASVVAAKKEGCQPTFDELNKYFTIAECRLHPASTGTASTGAPAEAREG